MALAENAGMNALKSLSTAKSLQTEKNDPFHGVDCIGKGVTSMKEQKVFETLLSKKGQLQLATQVVKMILKIDDVIEPSAQWFMWFKRCLFTIFYIFIKFISYMIIIKTNLIIFYYN